MHIVHTREPGSSNSYLAKFSLKKFGMIHIDQIIIYQRQPVAYSWYFRKSSIYFQGYLVWSWQKSSNIEHVEKEASKKK
jgi:hypothetical protein